MSYIDSLFDLEGKVAVLIGGTSELCGHMAFGLARAGVQVVIAGRNEERAEEKIRLIEEVGGNAYFVPTDLMKKGSLYALLDIVSETSGRIDILINGASINSGVPFFDIEVEDFQDIIDVNLTSIFQSCQVFGQYFVEHGTPASIINIGSVAGLNPLSKVFAYSASKAAVHNITRNLAREWADKEIRVNTIIPGFYPSEQHQKVQDEQRMLEIVRQTPMSRFLNPDELIGATLLLASNKAGGFITGTEILIDGGFNAMTL